MKVPTSFEDFNCRLYGHELQPNGEKLPVMYMGYDHKDNKFTINVRPNTSTFTDNYGVMQAKFFRSRAIHVMFEYMREVARSEVPTSRTLHLKDHPFVKQDGSNKASRSKEPKLIGAIKIEKKEDGMVYITLSKGKNYPRVEFLITNDDYYYVLEENGKPISDTENSRIAAQALADDWEARVNAIKNSHYKTEEWRIKKSDDNNGSDNGSNSSSSGGGSAWDDYDD